MRILYLTAKSKYQNEEELNKLIKKYTIPVRVSKIDYIKTYCKYLIDLFQPISCMDDSIKLRWPKINAFNGKTEDLLLSKKNLHYIVIAILN